MPDNRQRIRTLIVVVNILFGTMLLVAAAFHITFSILGIFGASENAALKGGLSATGAVLGIWSGLALLKQKQSAAGLAIAFSVVLLCFEGLLIYEGSFSPVIGTLVMLYAIGSSAFFVAERIRNDPSTPRLTRCPGCGEDYAGDVCPRCRPEA